MVDYPQLATRTGRFGFGAPRALTVAADGSRVFFLRSTGPADPVDRLWVLDAGTGALTCVGPASEYAAGAGGNLLTYAHEGRLHRLDLTSGLVEEVATAGPVSRPRPDPTGTHIAYVTGGSLRVVGADGDVLLAGEENVSWGEGYWWSPDGTEILAVRTGTATSLHILELDGGWVDVYWDRNSYPQLLSAHWGRTGPLLTVLRASQQHGLVLTVDARTGETQVHAELSDPHWVELISGSPVRLPDGRVLLPGELIRDGLDARCLFADGTLLTQPALYPREVLGLLDGELLLTASEGEPSEQHVLLVNLNGGGNPRRLSTEPGWHRAALGGSTYAIGSSTLEHPHERWRVVTPKTSYEIENLSAEPPYSPRPALTRVTDRRLPASVLYPGDHLAGRRLPVLVDSHGGPGHQRIHATRASWQERQWWADQGYAVVTVDGRGTPGISPSFEKVIHRRVGDLALADQVDALEALAAKHPDLDPARVAIRGTGFGGWLAEAAVLRRPDVFRAGLAIAPLELRSCPRAHLERYLGRESEHPEVYARHDLAEELAAPHGPLWIAEASDLDAELEFLRANL